MHFLEQHQGRRRMAHILEADIGQIGFHKQLLKELEHVGRLLRLTNPVRED